MAHGFAAVSNATYGGVYYTSNFTLSGDITWTKLPTTGLTSLGLNVFHVDPFDPINRQYLVTHPSSGNNIGDTISMRNGGNWTTIFDQAAARAIIGSTGDDWFSSIWPDPTIPGCLWTLYRWFYGFSVFRSLDYGATWTEKRRVNLAGNEIIEIQAYGDHVWIGYTGTIAYSPDLCATNYATGGAAVFQVEYPHSVTTAYTTSATGFAGELVKLAYSGGSFVSTTLHSGDNLAGNMYGNSRCGHVMWIDPYTAGHMRICDNGDTSDAVVRYTYDSWATYASTPTFGSGQAGQCTALNNTNNITAVIAGRKTSGNSSIYAAASEAGAFVLRNGANHASAPFADSVPSAYGLANYGIWVGDAPASKGVYVYSVEMESDTGWATDVTDYDKIGSPMGGDRASFRDLPADGFDVYHAEDVHAATPQIHAPWDEASPPGAGYGIISDGTKWEVSSAPIALTSSLHNAVTLDADAAAILDLQGTGGQEIGLDVQNANTVLAGPVSGAANEPTFRKLRLDQGDVEDVNVTGDGQGNILYQNSGTYEDYPLGIGTAFANEDGRIKIGDVAAGNYIEIDNTSGEVTLIGTATAWDDLVHPLIGEKLESPASDVTTDVAEGAIVYEDDATLLDYVVVNVQLSHRWKLGSDIFPHLHWWQASANVPNWLIQYRWQVQGAAKTTAWTPQAYDSQVFTYVSGTLNQISDFGAISPPAGAGLSDIVQFRILRDTDNDSTLFDADPLVGDAYAVQFDVHIEIDSFGSYTEYEKNRVEFRLTESGDFRLTESGDKRVIE